MTRLRLKFSKDGALRYVGHLDMAKAWERILRRAGLPVAYSQGFHPQPKIQFASALPVGCASVAEVMDVVLAQPLTPEEALRAITAQLPDGMRVLSAVEAPLNAPALQATLQSADYALTVETSEPVEVMRQRVQALLDSPSLPRERRGKTYDLRPLILDLRVEPPLALGQGAGSEGHITLWARLRASQDGGTGRPDELLDALGLSDAPVEICRTSLNF
jgi:radical SAM-linked protein